jgi:enamine deaminase RidA (YjgF/YER057c/UK114 family)
MRIPLLPPGHSKPVGKYSPGIALTGPLGELVFVSGQVAIDDAGRLLHPDDPAGQAEAVFDRIEAVLGQAGLGLADLASLTIYLLDLPANFAAVSAVRNRRLSQPGPSSAFVGVAALVEAGCLVEISGIAVGSGQP